ncbi:hypothetical protein PAMP_000942 [Pampus punctatissimus]
MEKRLKWRGVREGQDRTGRDGGLTTEREKSHSVHLWVGEEDQPMTHDPALTHDPNHLNNDLNHPNNHNLGNPEGLDARAVNKD